MLISSVRRGSGIASFAAGTAVGACATAIALGLIARFTEPALRPLRVWVLTAVVLAIAVLEASGRIDLLPQQRQLIPQWLVSVPGGPMRFGIEMGSGIRTFLPSGAPHLVATTLLLYGRAFDPLWLALGFSIGRSVVPMMYLGGEDGWLAAARRCLSPSRLAHRAVWYWAVGCSMLVVGFLRR